METLVAAAFVVLTLSHVLYTRWDRAYRSKLPPGPVGLPWIGNLFQLPTDHRERTLSRWRKDFGQLRTRLLGERVRMMFMLYCVQVISSMCHSSTSP